MNLFAFDFMQRALLAAVIIGIIAPLIGGFLVQRRLSLLGDGMGHVALSGVGLAFIAGTQPIPTAVVVVLVGSVLIELIQRYARAGADLALALLFYGGIAGGVMLTSLAAGQSSAALNQYLFGSLTTVAASDVLGLAIISVVVLALLLAFGRQFFIAALGADMAQVQGLRVRGLGVLLTMLAALTVVVGMRTVGLLLVSAIMIVPVATAQLWTRSFQKTLALAALIGLVASVGGLVVSFYLDVPPGPAIVLLALLVFTLAALLSWLMQRIRRRSQKSQSYAQSG